MRAATWLLTHFGVDRALIGDLIEQRLGGRSALWLWRQTVLAVAQRFGDIAQHDPMRIGIAAGVIAVALSLPYVWMHFLWHYAVRLDMAWYPGSMNWLARSSPQGVWQVLVFVHPWAWTYTAGWCVMLAAIAWCLARLHPTQRDLILAVFALSNVAECLPSLGRSLVAWWQEPANPIWISNFVMYALFAFVAIPLSVLGGGRRPMRSTTSDRIH